MSTNEDYISRLNDLVETCKDGEEGFQSAADGTTSHELKSIFQDYSRQRATFGSELRSAVTGLGGAPATSGHVSAALHRGWIDVKSAITGKDDQAILNECERGEDAAKANYSKAIGDGLPATVLTLVTTQFAEVKRTHDHIKSLRDSGINTTTGVPVATA